MDIKILSEENSPQVSKIKKKFNIFRVIDIKEGKFEIIELFNKDGVFRGVGYNTKQALNKAKKVAKKFYKKEGKIA